MPTYIGQNEVNLILGTNEYSIDLFSYDAQVADLLWRGKMALFSYLHNEVICNADIEESRLDDEWGKIDKAARARWLRVAYVLGGYNALDDVM